MADDLVLHLNDSNFKTTIGDGGTPVVVDFWAEWCGPCRQIAPVFKTLASEMEGKVRFAKVNVDEANGTAGEFGVRSIPTFIVFKDGKVSGKITGAMPKEMLKQKIEELS
jgi:thioredoxin 1